VILTIQKTDLTFDLTGFNTGYILYIHRMEGKCKRWNEIRLFSIQLVKKICG